MAKRGPSHAQQVLDYIVEFGSITPAEAVQDLGIYRLAARIYDLRRKGHPIYGECVHALNRWGKPIKFKRYRLKKEA